MSVAGDRQPRPPQQILEAPFRPRLHEQALRVSAPMVTPSGWTGHRREAAAGDDAGRRVSVAGKWEDKTVSVVLARPGPIVTAYPCWK